MSVCASGGPGLIFFVAVGGDWGFCLLRRHYLLRACGICCVPTAVAVSFVIGLLAFPLCGGHLLFFAGRKEK